MGVMVQKIEKQINWAGLILFTLGFWLSGSLLLDLVIMPCLSATGMISEESFTSALYVIFGIFNRIELVCAALVLTTVLVFRHYHNFSDQELSWATSLSIALFTIAIIYTYILTPQLSAYGLQLNFDLFNNSHKIPQEMMSLQGSYWFLEVAKLLAGMSLLKLFYRSACVFKGE